jgi:hypothetical protein
MSYIYLYLNKKNPSIANSSATITPIIHQEYPLDNLNCCYLEDFMQLKNNRIIKLLVPFDGLDYNDIDTSIGKHNSHSLEEYIQYFNIPLMCFGSNEKSQRYYCIECVITSTPYCENTIIGAISNNDLLKLGMSSHKYGS